MLMRRIVCSAVVAAAVVPVLFSDAKAQYYSSCPPNPLAWPFCIAGAAVGTAAAIATAPVAVVAGAPYYGSYYYGEPYYYPRPYYRHVVYRHHHHKKTHPPPQ